MTHPTVLLCALGCGLILLMGGVSGQGGLSGTAGDEQCTISGSCVPWEATEGVGCARATGRIALEFILDLANESSQEGYDGVPVCKSNASDYSGNITYAFCPIVDELQAFNLTHSGNFSSIYTDSASGAAQISSSFAESNRYLRVKGFGQSNSRTVPQQGESEGATVVAGLCPSNSLKVAIVPFLILNISMELGRFKYYADWPQPGGVGFVPTCTVSGNGEDTCRLDHTLECLGDVGAKNCAVCYDAASDGIQDIAGIQGVSTQVWTSYYGTDRNGRQLRSGSNNPLNFQAFGGGSTYTALSTSLDKVSSGNFDDDASEPSVRLRRHITQLRSQLKE